jgi:hypothetical protein
MALPKLDVPVHELMLPLTKKKVRYRPFLVKEEKILLMAMESNEEKTVIDSIKQIINNCCLDQIDIDNLPVLDLEFFFLNLRARSVGEIVNLQYKCNNKIKNEDDNEKDCGNIVKFDVNILEIEPEINPEHTNKIQLDSKLGIMMKYPNFKLIENINENTEIESVMKIISNCIDYIFDENNIYYKKDITQDELNEFIDGLTAQQFAKIQNFFNTIPKIKKDIDFKCSKCGYNEKITVEGIQNFFV